LKKRRLDKKITNNIPPSLKEVLRNETEDGCEV